MGLDGYRLLWPTSVLLIFFEWLIFSGWPVFSGERHLLGLYGRKLKSEEHALMESQVEKPGYVKWDDIEVEQLSSLIGRQFVVGKDVMVARVLLKKGANVPRHQHHNEQIT